MYFSPKQQKTETLDYEYLLYLPLGLKYFVRKKLKHGDGDSCLKWGGTITLVKPKKIFLYKS
jgi:hypothetical protein